VRNERQIQPSASNALVVLRLPLRWLLVHHARRRRSRALHCGGRWLPLLFVHHARL